MKVDINCSYCKGFGDVYVDNTAGSPDQKTEPCDECGGSGLETVDAEEHLSEELCDLAGAIEDIEHELGRCGIITTEIRKFLLGQVHEIMD